jgi:hypothetical protein
MSLSSIIYPNGNNFHGNNGKRQYYYRWGTLLFSANQQETGAVGLRGGHSQGEIMDELNHNLKKVVELLLENGKPKGRLPKISV